MTPEERKLIITNVERSLKVARDSLKIATGNIKAIKQARKQLQLHGRGAHLWALQSTLLEALAPPRKRRAELLRTIERHHKELADLRPYKASFTAAAPHIARFLASHYGLAGAPASLHTVGKSKTFPIIGKKASVVVDDEVAEDIRQKNDAFKSTKFLSEFGTAIERAIAEFNKTPEAKEADEQARLREHFADLIAAYEAAGWEVCHIFPIVGKKANPEEPPHATTCTCHECLGLATGKHHATRKAQNDKR